MAITCRLKINNYAERDKVVSGLANSGYKVWVEEVKDSHWQNHVTDYLVSFEIEPVSAEKDKE